MVKSLGHPMPVPPAEAGGGDALPSHFSSQAISKHPFHDTSVPCFLFCLILLLKMAPESSAEMLSSVPKFKKTVICLTKKIQILAVLHSGKHYSAAGLEFSVNESTIY